MASTPRAVPTDAIAAVPSSPAGSPKEQARHNRKKQKRAGGSNNGSHTQSGMCEAPEANWPGSTTAPDRQLTAPNVDGLQLQPAALVNSSRHSYDGAGRCRAGNSQCSCDSSSDAAVSQGEAANGATVDAANGSSGSRSSSKHSAGQASRQQRRHAAGNAASGSSQAAGGGGGCSGSRDDGDDDHQDAWRRRKLAAGRGVHKQQHKPQEQQQEQQSEDSVALDTDARQQQAQPQEAAVCKLRDSRSGSPSRVNGYAKGHGAKHRQQQQQQQSSDIQLQALSIQQPGAEQHGWVPIQFGDLPVLLGASPDSSPVTSLNGSRGSRGKSSQLQTMISVPGVHHSTSSGCVVSRKEHALVQQQQHSKNAEWKQQHMSAAELASLALTAATNALTVSPRVDKQCEVEKPQNGRMLHLQWDQLQVEQLQQQGKGAAAVNGRYIGSKATQLAQPQEQQQLLQPVSRQQQQQQLHNPGASSTEVPQLQQQRQLPATSAASNSICPVTPSGEVGHEAAISKGDLLAPRSPQLSSALLEQFGLRVGPLNGGLLPNEKQLRAAIEQAGVGAVLVVREDEQVRRQGADELASGGSSSGALAGDVPAQAAGAGSSGCGTSSSTGIAEQSSSNGPAPNPVPAAAGAGSDGNGTASSSQDSRGASKGQRSAETERSLPAVSPSKGPVPTDSSAGSGKGYRNTENNYSSPRSAVGKESSRNPQQHQLPAVSPPVQLQVQVPDAGVDDCSIASSSSSIQASSSTSNPWQQHESAVAVLQLGGGLGAHHAADNGSISARSHGHGVFGPGLGGLHPQQLYAGSVAGGMSHSSSPHLSHHMDQSDIMSDPGTVPGGGFVLGDGSGGGYSRMKPGRNRFMPNHHLVGGAAYYGSSGAGSSRHRLQDPALLMQQFGNGGGARGGAGSGGSRRGGGGSRDGDGASSRATGSGSNRDGDSSGGRRGGNNGGRRNSGKDYGLPRSPQLSHGIGSNRRSFENRGGAYAGGPDGSRGSGRQTPLPSPGSRSTREQRDHNSSSRDVPSPHLAGSSSSNSLAGHPSPLLLPEPALASGPGSGRGGSSGGIAPMQDLPPSAAAAAGLPPHGPPTDLERFLAATGPTVPVNPSMPLQQVLKQLTLKSVWDLFLEPSLCGTAVGTLGGPRGPSTAYYVPYMSAMQLFTSVADSSPSPLPPPPAPASSDAAACSTAAANSSSASNVASSRSSSSSGSPTPSSCSGASSSTQSYAAVAAGASPAPSATNAGSAAASSMSAAAAAAASSSVQVGPGGRGRLYTCAVKGWPPVMRLLLEHMEQELPFSRDPFYIQLEAMSGGQEVVEAAVAAAAAATPSGREAVSDVVAAGGSAAVAADTSNGAQPAADSARAATPAIAGSYTACGYPLVGPDLMTTRLLDIHPASWFAVAWYPVYRIPDAPLTARFLTFYSFAQLLEVLNDAVSAANANLSEPCNLAGLPMPVVGMKWYNLLKERWLELLGTPGNGQQAMIPAGGRRGGNSAARAAAASNNSSGSDQPALQLLRMHPVRFKEWQARLEDLQVQAGRLSKGGGLKVLTPQGPKEVRLYHSDYEFFNSRP